MRSVRFIFVRPDDTEEAAGSFGLGSDDFVPDPGYIYDDFEPYGRVEVLSVEPVDEVNRSGQSVSELVIRVRNLPD